ncbi:hypothetical protein J2741_000710 [Methanolinea mesophila]|uniref:purple acid phosphatase family protein n=1 Tax=Methanolinea mesophila TaxID=547055 RepID=UPI001AE5F53F|nr:metallophosphoesterase family protein [Methanolinea mesophila]MBP1928163.1 hypothetical protein [Methanolinea mesophila]
MSRVVGRTPAIPGRKRNAPLIVLLAIGLVILALPTPSAGDLPDDPAGTEWGPLITNTSPWSATIQWKTHDSVVGGVEYLPFTGGSPEGPNITVTENAACQVHRVTLRSLAPGTMYVYRLSGYPGWFTLRTFPEHGPVRFIVYGDTRGQEGWKDQELLRKSVADAIARENDIMFVVHTGDLVYDPGNASDWGEFFSLSGEFMGNTSFFPVAGNHEGNLAAYHRIFGMPDGYSFSCGDARLIVLDSNVMDAAEETAQAEWLRHELATTTGPIFVALHHPLYSSETNHYGGRQDLRESFGTLFTRAGVTAVFSAHVHAYEHYWNGGVQYFTVGTGGAPFYPLSAEKPAGHVKSLENTAGYAVVTVEDEGITVDFIRVAEVREGNVILFPPGSVAERTEIGERPGMIIPFIGIPFENGNPDGIRFPFGP